MIFANMPSPFGANSQKPDTIVVHAMGEFIDTDSVDYFAPAFIDSIGLSAHFFVPPSGVVIQTRQISEGGYHAKGANKNSIGIEFLVPGLHTYETFLQAIEKPYLTDVQYKAGIDLIQYLKVKISQDFRIHVLDYKRHSDISPGRKYDPGRGFPWKLFLEDVK